MSTQAVVAEARRSPEIRPDFLGGQMREWLERIEAGGKIGNLFELEMWLRSFERFFRVRNQPLSEVETSQLAIRNWSEELRLVDNVVVRVVQLCNLILTEEQVNHTRFGHYVESYLRKDDHTDPYVEKLLRSTTPESSLTLMRETFENLHLLLTELVRLSRIRFATFQAVGRLLFKEVRRNYLLAYLLDKKFKPIHDRISNPIVASFIRDIPDTHERRLTARILLELFRLLHYLDYTNPANISEGALKNTILVFALITSETRMLLHFIERRALKSLSPQHTLYQVCDSLVYCLPLELKKVLNTELIDISVARQIDNVRARIENSHGILRDCFEQSVVQLLQVLKPEIQGHDIFPNFTAKREQSVLLRDSLECLIEAVRGFLKDGGDQATAAMRNEISNFYDNQMRFLMYRDWAGFEIFFIEILKCSSHTALQQIAHRFETFLSTLHREIMKRTVLQGAEEQDVPAGAV